jgi:hypothetical protein
MTEEWTAIPGFPGYELSNCGRVRSWVLAYTPINRSPNDRRIRVGEPVRFKILKIKNGKVHLRDADGNRADRVVGKLMRELYPVTKISSTEAITAIRKFLQG